MTLSSATTPSGGSESSEAAPVTPKQPRTVAPATSFLASPTHTPPTGAIPVIDPPMAGKFPILPLIMLAVAVFLCITSEMIPTGLMPQMSEDLGVSESKIGLLVSVFAFTVVLTSVPLTVLTRKVHRHHLVVALIVILAVSNLITALAPSYELVMASRILGGLAHGVFWGTVGAYSARLVPKESLGRAVAITGSGGSLALILGIPLGTAAGAVIGWRTTFVVLTVLMLVGAVLILRFLPRVRRSDVENGPRSSATTQKRPRDVTALPVALYCLLTGILMIGLYSFYSYIAPYLLIVVGVDEPTVAVLLFVYGLAGAAGLLLVGTIFSTRPQKGVLISIVAAGVMIAVLALSSDVPWLMVGSFFVWGVAAGCIPPLMQTRIFQIASPALRDESGAYLTMGFNVGIGGGALLGGVIFDLLGPQWLPVVYGGILILGFGLAFVAHGAARRSAAHSALAE